MRIMVSVYSPAHWEGKASVPVNAERPNSAAEQRSNPTIETLAYYSEAVGKRLVVLLADA